MRKVAFALLCPAAVAAQPVPHELTYTGRVTIDGVAPDRVDVVFRLFDQAAGADTALWEESHDDVEVDDDGFFDLALGGGRPSPGAPSLAAALDGGALFLEVEIDGEPLLPRVPVRSVPYALRAEIAAALDDAALAGGGAATTAARSDHGHDYLPTGEDVDCDADEKVIGLDVRTGDVECAPDVTLRLAGGGAADTAARSDHLHDAAYAAAGHLHDGRYAASAHAHDTAYAAAGHEHAALYAALGHHHDASYAAQGHQHDARYALTGHDHGGDYLPGGGGVCPDADGVVTGVAPDGEVLCDPLFSTLGAARAADGVPAGMIGFFARACPEGWTEYAPLQGRFLVGAPANGTVADGVGTPMGDLGTLSHGHTFSDVVNHTHSIDPPATTTTGTGVHGHSLPMTQTSANSGTGSSFTLLRQTGTINITGDGSHSHTVDPSPFASSNPTPGVAQGTTALAADTPPYLQLRACQRN